jgi:glycosyltransferase involved in cell wall biosynthesis
LKLAAGPFFSIIIPTHNSAPVLGRAINSILCQRFTDFEVLVVDGLSTDDTTKVARSFTDARISIISEKDNGIYDAMNKGIARSTGKWMYFMGSDDQLHDPKILQHIHDVIQTNPSSKFVYGDVMTSNSGMQSYRNYNYLKLLAMCICHQAIFYHRSLFDDILYDPRYRVCGDWDFNLKVFRRRNHPVYVNVPVAIFNITGASNNWINHPEYLENFKSRTKTILRYRNPGYLIYYYFSAILGRIKHRSKRFYQKLLNMSGA